MRIRAYTLWLTIFSMVAPAPGQTLSSEERNQFFISGRIDIRQMAVGPTDLPKGSPEACANARIAAKVLADAGMAEKVSGLFVEAFRDVGSAGLENVNVAKEELRRTHIPGGIIIEGTETPCSEFARTGEYWITVRYTSRDVIPVVMEHGRSEMLRVVATPPNPSPT